MRDKVFSALTAGRTVDELKSGWTRYKGSAGGRPRASPTAQSPVSPLAKRAASSAPLSSSGGGGASDLRAELQKERELRARLERDLIEQVSTQKRLERQLDTLKASVRVLLCAPQRAWAVCLDAAWQLCLMSCAVCAACGVVVLGGCREAK